MTKQILTAISLLLLFSTCKRDQMDDCITSSGPTRTITRYLEPFKGIEVGDYTDLYIKQDSSQPVYVKITGGRNLMNGIITDIDNGTLYIENQNVCNWVRNFHARIKVEVNVHSLGQIRTTEDAAITGSDLLFEDVINVINESSNNIYLYGSFKYLILNQKLQGDIAVDGHAEILVLNNEGVGKVELGGCQGDYVYVNHWGKNNVTVNAYKGLEVYLYGSGNVFYILFNPVEFKRFYIHGSGFVAPR